MEINNKFNVNDEVWTVYRKPIEYKCPVCEGKVVFGYNSYSLHCPHCNGTGKVHDAKTLWAVTDETIKIRRIIVSIWQDIQTVKYKVFCSSLKYNIRNRSEETLFATKEEAEEWCKINNKAIEVDNSGKREI